MEPGPSRYLVEHYVSRTDVAAALRSARELGAAAAALSGEGTPIRHVRAIFVPEDETCFHLFEAVSSEAVGAAGERAAVPFGRIAGAVEIGREPDGAADGAADLVGDARAPQTTTERGGAA